MRLRSMGHAKQVAAPVAYVAPALVDRVKWNLGAKPLPVISTVPLLHGRPSSHKPTSLSKGTQDRDADTPPGTNPSIAPPNYRKFTDPSRKISRKIRTNRRVRRATKTKISDGYLCVDWKGHLLRVPDDATAPDVASREFHPLRRTTWLTKKPGAP